VRLRGVACLLVLAACGDTSGSNGARTGAGDTHGGGVDADIPIGDGSAPSPEGASDAGRAPIPPSTPRVGISYGYPASYSDWANGFLAGNGKLGVIVFGNPLEETVVFNDRGFNMAKTNDRSFNQMSANDLNTIKNDDVSGSYAAANALAVSSSGWTGGGEGNRHPGFEMLITIPPNGAVNHYSRTCNYRTGEISVQWTDESGDWVRRTFVSREDNVVVQYLTAPSKGKLSCTIQLATDPAMSFPGAMTFTNVSTADFLNLRAEYGPGTNGAGYEGVTRVVASGGSKSIHGNVVSVSGADSLILISRSAKYYANASATWAQRPIQGKLATIATDYDTLLAGQRGTHEAIYDRVQLDLHASDADRARANEDLLAAQASSSTPIKALWERVFDAGRYHYLSSSSELSPPDLLGMWTGDTNVGWGGFYHLDANLNLQIAGGNIGDMPEAMEGYFHLIEAWRTDFETNATKLLGCRGMLACGNSPGATSGLIAGISDYYPYQYATGEMGWLLYPFWEHYLVTGDTTFLRMRLYPLLREMADFYQDFLTKTDSNGHYVFAGSVSPENQPSNVQVSLVDNSTFDISGAKFILSALVQAASTLQMDQGPGQGVMRWTAMLAKLPPYLINSDGALQEWSWPGLLDNYNHRHSSGLLPVWPFREITPESDMTLFNAAVMTLKEKDKYSYENAGHGILHAGLIAANVNNDPSVLNKLMRLTSEGFYFNGLATSHYAGHGVFCTDAANALPAIMMEMLVSSSPGTLELLPALPAVLDQGTLWGIKGRNRVTVQELRWDLGSGSIAATVASDIDQDVTLIVRKGIRAITTTAATHDSPLGPIAKVVHLAAGASTEIAIAIPHNLALHQPVIASSVADNSPAAQAVDGDPTTRWSSGHADSEWLSVDLGSVQSLTGARLLWESAYGKAYKIQVSTDGTSWIDAYATTNGGGGVESVSFTASGRYVRMQGVQRATAYGYSLWELEVY
jgi:alpha-L-fucosidase 2